MLELLQPVSWLLHAWHGCYNQMCGCNNLKNSGCFNQVMVVSTEKLVVTQGCFNQVGFIWVGVACF